MHSIQQSIADESVKSRIEFLQLDVCDDASVASAADTLREKYGSPCLYAVVNNAAIGVSHSLSDTLQTNVYGPKRVTEALLSLISRGDPGSQERGRIVNIASGAAPMYLAKCTPEEVRVFTHTDTTWADLELRLNEELALDALNNESVSGELGHAYGMSKACLNAYTMLIARENPDVSVNSCTPGFIATDLTANMGATLPPEAGTRAPLYCLFDPAAGVASGWYYGSDAVRSPLDRYRAPGDAPYEP